MSDFVEPYAPVASYWTGDVSNETGRQRREPSYRKPVASFVWEMLFPFSPTSALLCLW